jgi:UDP-N-acetylmuramoyl-L-alanyl-D-glutamate--2,6-diaminopimelate ligase
MFDEKGWKKLLQLSADKVNVRTDSRKVEPGDIFVAIPGPKQNGADFIPQAVEKGAAYILTCAEIKECKAEVIRHPDPAAALGELARAYFKTDRLKLKVVGITGTNGKTTVSYLIEHLLSSAGMKVGVLGTVAYRWPGFKIDAPLTTPDCWTLHSYMAKMEADGVDVAVMEVSSHALHQNRAAGIEFDCAVLTNVTQDHLDYHGDMESYFEAKSLLFKSCPREGKQAVINYDDPYGKRLLEDYSPATGFGLTDPYESKAGQLHGEMLSCTGNGLHLKMTYKGQSWELDSDLIGRHNGSNLLAAQGVGLFFGLTAEDMKKFSSFHGVPGRLERVRNDKGLNIFVDYAHTPDALDNVLSTLNELDFERVITVFGCGGDRDRTKRPLMGKAVCSKTDIAVMTSDNPRTENPEAILDDIRPGLSSCTEVIEEVDRSKAIRKAVEIMNSNDVLLIAGKGHETYQIVGTTKHPFSDSEEVTKALGEIYA